MDEKDKQNLDEQIIDGQMAYDELLTSKKESKKEEKSENVVLNGQFDIFEAISTPKDDNESNQTQTLQKPKKKLGAKTVTKKAKQITIDDGEARESTIYRSLGEVMHDSMIPYTEYVVLDRALPRVEDGLKPVQRRILFSMLELGLTPDKPYRKSARIVGDCMGKYHPHGDSSVYDAMVRMSQDFALREPLVKGHGNFGSIDGDSAAAMRYTEAKLTPLAMLLLKDLEKDTVKWSLNFDDTIKEPDMLPGAYPNLLVNGASGIAVGVATNIPPHNLKEVIDGIVEYISNKKITLQEMMKIIKGPDFPTGGTIIASDELEKAYQTGRGKIIVRAKVNIEKVKDREQIVITELPYQVNKSNLLKKIVDLKSKEKDKLSVITEIRDESDRNGIRAVIKLKTGANAQAILNYLYKSTQLQTTFGINMVAIANGRPKQLGLLEIIDYYVEYQREIVLRKTKYELNIARERAHIVRGLLIAIANIDEVIKIIKGSKNVALAKQAVRERFELSDKQAQAIMDMRLARLVNLEIVKLETEIAELEEKIKKLEAIVASKRRQYTVVKNALLDVKKQFGNARRSALKEVDDLKEVKQSVKLEAEQFAKEVVVGLTASGNLKQIPLKNYTLSQKTITKTSGLNDIHTNLIKIMSNETLIVFTNKGNAIKLRVSDIPEAKWRDKGTSLSSIVKAAGPTEQVVNFFKLEEDKLPNKLLFVYTKKGYIKSIKFEDCIISKNYYYITKLKNDDEVLSVQIDDESQNVVLVTKLGNALNFAKSDVPTQSRNASGVMGINISSEDEVVCSSLASVKGSITLIANNGYAKRMPISELNVMSRYRKGQRVMPFEARGKALIYGDYSENAADTVLVKGDKLTLIGQRNISIDIRISKGRQIAKGNFDSVFTYLD